MYPYNLHNGSDATDIFPGPRAVGAAPIGNAKNILR